jgi:hypothetical protein
MKSIISLLPILSLLFLGCSNKGAEPDLEDPIKLICKGVIRHHFKASGYPEERPKKTITTTYIFRNIKTSDGKHATWNYSENGGPIVEQYNYHNIKQDGRPREASKFIVNEQRIDFTHQFWQEIDKNETISRDNKTRVVINRFTGDWYAYRNNKTKWNNGDWMNAKEEVQGRCELAVQKF